MHDIFKTSCIIWLATKWGSGMAKRSVNHSAPDPVKGKLPALFGSEGTLSLARKMGQRHPEEGALTSQWQYYGWWLFGCLDHGNGPWSGQGSESSCEGGWCWWRDKSKCCGQDGTDLSGPKRYLLPCRSESSWKQGDYEKEVFSCLPKGTHGAIMCSNKVLLLLPRPRWLRHGFHTILQHTRVQPYAPPPPPVPQLQFYALWDMSFTVRGDMHTASHACGLSGHLSWQVQRWNVQSVHHQHVRQWQPVVQVQKVDTLKAETSRYVSLHTCWPMKSHIHRRMKWVIEMYWSHTKWTTHGSWSVRAKFSCHIRSGSAVTLRMRCIVHHKSCTANVIPDNYWHALSLQPRHGPF